jgi:hypothetical protein
MNPNGHLGVWLAASSALAKRFGRHCLAVDADFKRIYRMSITELSALNTECRKHCSEFEDDGLANEAAKAFYQQRRQALIADGYDSLAIVELNNNVEILVALNTEVLTIVPTSFKPNKISGEITMRSFETEHPADGYDITVVVDERLRVDRVLAGGDEITLSYLDAQKLQEEANEYFQDDDLPSPGM